MGILCGLFCLVGWLMYHLRWFLLSVAVLHARGCGVRGWLAQLTHSTAGAGSGPFQFGLLGLLQCERDNGRLSVSARATVSVLCVPKRQPCAQV